ncbi:MAG: hypothetical protein AAFN81_34795, partial [Bacteroidota bacterium]
NHSPPPRPSFLIAATTPNVKEEEAINSFSTKNFIQKPVSGGIPAIEKSASAANVADDSDERKRERSET